MIPKDVVDDAVGQVLDLTEEKRAGLTADEKFRVDITPYFASLIDPDDPNDPIRRQVIQLGREQQAFAAGTSTGPARSRGRATASRPAPRTRTSSSLGPHRRVEDATIEPAVADDTNSSFAECHPGRADNLALRGVSVESTVPARPVP